MLVDSSVWIPYLRGDALPEVALLRATLEGPGLVWIAPVILQEVLQGADHPERFDRWERALGGLPMLPSRDAAGTARHAARIHAKCRWSGITPRSTNDCLIAAIAIEHRTPLLHRDADFLRIAGVATDLALLAIPG
jgi:predicted nucleic acid-binding protein